MKGRRERPFSCRMNLQRWLRQHQAHGCCPRFCRATVLNGIELPTRCLLPFLPKSDADWMPGWKQRHRVSFGTRFWLRGTTASDVVLYLGRAERTPMVLSRIRKPQKSGENHRQNLGTHYVACLAVLLDQRFGGGHNASCGDGTPTRMACEKFGETPSSCALAAMCAADRSCDKGTEMSSAPRS